VTPAPSPLALALAGLAALALAMGFGRFAYTPILPHMLAHGGLTLPLAGPLASVNFAGYLAGALAAALPLFGRARARWLWAALAASALTTAAAGMTRDYGLWLAIRFSSGLASAFVFVLASAITLDALARAGRLPLSALLYAGVGVGIALSALGVDLIAIRWLAGGAEAWSAAWLGLGALAGALAVMSGVVLTRAENAAPAATPKAAAARTAAPPAGLRRLIFAYALFGFGYVITATFIVTLARQAGLGAAAETVVWLLFGLTAAPSVWLWSRLAARFGHQRAFAAALLLEGLGVAVSLLSGSLLALALAAALLGGTFMGITALGLMEARRLRPDAAQGAVARMTAAFALGQMVGPSFATMLARDGDLGPGTLAAAAALGLAALIAPRKNPGRAD
jgi:predicted MFS family arabinose efflux permease